jgi:hypothetical protein
VNGPVRLAAAGLVLLVASGCGAASRGGQATASGCASFAVRSVERHATVPGLPRACRGLGPRELEQALAITVSHFARARDKAVRRHQAGLARQHLTYLVVAGQRARAEQAAAARRRGSRRPAASSAAGIGVPAGLAALIAWLLTVASGAFLLAKWLAQSAGGSRARRAPPAVVLSHLGLATGGLVAWSCYLLTSWAPLAWLAMAVLLPVVGLGISTLMLAVPDTGADPATAVAGRPSAGRARPPVVVIVAHGTLAALTVLLVLLGAIAAVLAR